MKELLYFYKIENEKLQNGTGFNVPAGFSEYILGKEPIELLPLIEAERVKAEQDKVISEAKQYLNDTDYKVLPDYDGDTDGIIEARAEARATIRAIEAE